MKYVLVVLALLIALPLSAATTQPPKAAAAAAKDTVIDSSYKEIGWEALIPKDWDPAKPFRNLKLGALMDGDPKAMEVLDMIKREWDKAPINPAVDGKKVKIPGFVVPIEANGREVTEFLLVPYFGACIHVPPPPANQIIHVISAKPIKNLRVMDVVWVAGELKAAHYATQTDMGMGASGYQLNSIAVTAYKDPAVVTTNPSR